MKKAQFFLLLILLCSSSNIASKIPAHAIYISICEITYDTQQLDIFIKVFTNDLEDAIRNQTGEITSVENNLDKAAVNKKINKYLSSVVHLAANNATLQMDYIDSKKENDATWAHFIVNDIDPPKQLKIENQIFTEIFDAQLNVVTLKFGEEKKYLRLDRNKTEGSITLD
jgi:hypothetical protein